MLNLDTLEISDRMRSYRKRQIQRVQPRSDVSHLTRRVGMDVWESAPSVQLKAKLSTTQAKGRESMPITSKTSVEPLPLQANNLKKGEAQISKPIVQETKNLQNAVNQPLPKTDFAQSAKEWKQQKKAKKQLSWLKPQKPFVINFAMYGMAVLVFLIGITAGIRSFMLDHKIAQTVSAQAGKQEENSVQDVDESKPNDNEVRNYSVAPDMPKIITIPKINVKSRIKQLAMKADGSLDAPKNIFDAGWYNQSSKPGSPGGASLIDGHVSGPTQKGVFYNIKNLKSGDVVTIERGDGSKLDYKVIKVDIIKATEVDMSKMLLSVTPGTHGLNLITCTGKFDSASKTYADRALVYTQFVKAY